MTREEAIQLIDEIASSYYPCDKKDALEMAIKALEQQPCEDCISRKDILNCQYTIDESETLGISTRNVVNVDDILNAKPVQPKYNVNEWCKDCKEYDHDKHCCPRYNKVIRSAVEEMKQPKTGHWIFDEILDRNYYCSECKSMGVDYWDYCPYCGCRMVESQESEDKE